jgi:hypothetical protein
VFERKKDCIEQVIEMVLVVPIFKKYKPWRKLSVRENQKVTRALSNRLQGAVA